MPLFVVIEIFCWLLVNSNLSKTLMVLLVCLTFVGQAMASTVMSYHMMSMKVMNGQEKNQSMSMMDHSDHTMMNHASDDSDDSDESTEDCCVKTCSCFTGGCSSIATLMKDINNNLFIDLSSKISSYSHLALSQQPTSLYRPPILS